MIINTELARSSGHKQSDLWETPPHVFHPLDAEFDFTLDPCCAAETAKCQKYFTPTEDGLLQDWSGERVFCNPPYSRGNIDKWMKKCYEESLRGVFIVALIPVSTSSNWFHRYILNTAEIRYLMGRVRFVGAPYTAPFSSMLAIYNRT